MLTLLKANYILQLDRLKDFQLISSIISDNEFIAAIAADATSSIVIGNTTIVGNDVFNENLASTDHQGCVSVVDSVVTMNSSKIAQNSMTVTQEIGGTAIFARGHTNGMLYCYRGWLRIRVAVALHTVDIRENNVIESNSGITSGGGAISCRDSCRIDMANTNLVENSALRTGINLFRTTYNTNLIAKGGALEVYGSCEVNIDSSRVKGNKARDGGVRWSHV